MLKIKHLRTADCVVAGFRWHTSGPVVGSLLLGLYDDERRPAARRRLRRRSPRPAARELVDELAPYRTDDLDRPPLGGVGRVGRPDRGRRGRAPARARRRAGTRSKDLSWVPLRPELVCEVAYDHMEGTRFRHTAQFQRWRPDRDPASCTYDQLERRSGFDLAGGPGRHAERRLGALGSAACSPPCC